MNRPKTIYQDITDTIKQQLIEGSIPWVQPWKDDSIGFAIPRNFSTGNYYNGINILLLEVATQKKKLKTHDWGSYLQWQQLGEQVKKGERGTPIIYASTYEVTKENDEKKNVPFIKSSTVFNRSQLESYRAEKKEQLVQKPLVERIQSVEDFINKTDVRICYEEAYGACYVGATDTVYMPYPASFIETEHCTATVNYYKTLLHEIGHWTGHSTRLNRKSGTSFGSKAYAQEELTVELAAAFMLSKLDITETPVLDHSAYIKNWLQVIDDLEDNRFGLVAAASAASKVCDYLFTITAAKLVATTAWLLFSFCANK